MKKKLAIVAGGWHFPVQFYKGISSQYVADGWHVDLFCVAHRPAPGKPEEKENIWGEDESEDKNLLSQLDRYLYQDFADENMLQRMGWHYSLEPNTTGDFGFANQWFEKTNYKDYDLFLFTHDDNLILSSVFIKRVLKNQLELYEKDEDGATTLPAKDDKWLILANSTTPNKYHLRGATCVFFKRKVIDMMGGEFDDSGIKLKRIGNFDTPDDWAGLTDWNKWTDNVIDFIMKNKLEGKLKYLSPFYRTSRFCIEGERGLIQNTDWGEEFYIQGINYLIDNEYLKIG